LEGKTSNGCFNGYYIFNNTWLVGQYNYTIYAKDKSNNSNFSSEYSFNVSAYANISICTVNDTYGAGEYINITDPPGCGSSSIGYQLLDNNSVLHIWNKYDSYYFNTSSGIQLTNHKDEYWTHNILMLGYYNNDQWNLIYRTDELSGFNKDIESDNETYINITIWKDLKNIDDQDINLVLGFGWELRDIQIDMTENDDYIQLGNETYLLNQTLDNTYTNLSTPIYCWNSTTNTTKICGYSDPAFYLIENISENSTKSLYLRWSKDLTYKLCVKSYEGQYNAPTTLYVRVGTLDIGQEKYTEMFWYDASQETYYFNSYDTKYGWDSNPGYMVDGSTSSYARTGIIDDEEYCDQTTYGTGGAPSGTISKVEIRAYGYYGERAATLSLQPKFTGGNGDNHYYYLTGTASWSSWYDITDDTNAPVSWSWSDIGVLDCSVVLFDIYEEDMAYCSKVEVRVTYSATPSISNPVPADDSINISISPTLSINVSDADGDSMDITWLSNSSGSWVSFGTNDSVYNGTYYQVFSNASVNGCWWYWKVNVSDGVVSTESDVYRFYTGVQSKIVNTGSTNISGYLLIQVQYYNESLGDWIVDNDTINETTPRTINTSEQLALDIIFNGLVSTDDLVNGDGSYRVYAAFRDPDGDVLICNDETALEAWYEFEVDTG